MATKRFVASSNAKRGIKAEFELEWEDKEGEAHVETFYCWPARAPGAVLFDLTGISNTSGPMWEFYEAVMGDGYEEFRTFVRNADHGVEAETLREVTSWIIEYDTGTPTLPSAT
jgi:hypothetical protein